MAGGRKNSSFAGRKTAFHGLVRSAPNCLPRRWSALPCWRTPLARRVSAELFRLRDAEDNVIGVAGRLAGTGGAIADPGRSASNWLIVIPSRGALFLTQSDVQDTTVRESSTPTAAWPWRRRRPRLLDRPPAFPDHGARAGRRRAGTTGRVLRGTSEFAGLRGSFTETWDLEEVNADGSTRGRILLSTITVGGN